MSVCRKLSFTLCAIKGGDGFSTFTLIRLRIPTRTEIGVSVVKGDVDMEVGGGYKLRNYQAV